jgi:rSAM/selenodomain-associated transferase 2/rSAM/selenodomain-associated transferase 1
MEVFELVLLRVLIVANFLLSRLLYDIIPLFLCLPGSILEFTQSLLLLKKDKKAPFFSRQKTRIVILTREPVPNQCKTRLIPELGPETALLWHVSMAKHTLLVAGAFAAEKAIFRSVCVAVDGEPDEVARLAIDGEGIFRFFRQGKGGLGGRIRQAVAQALEREAGSNVIVLGTDCPGLLPGHLDVAEELLRSGADVCFGPAADGGFWLVGIRGSVAPEALFSDEKVRYGTEHALQDSLDLCASAGLAVRMLQVLSDVDEPRDRVHLDAAVASGLMTALSRISVVIPARNEERAIGGTIRSALASAADPGKVDFVVVDAGSEDGTRAAATEAGARVIASPAHLRGRGSQMNLGAAHSKPGSLLLFLHADTALPAKWDARLRECLCRPEVSSASFSLSIAGQQADRRLATISSMANYRSRRGLPYGDQGLALRAPTFSAVGGFDAVPLFEDFLIAARLAKLGQVVTLPQEVVTSARRWEKNGALKNTAINLALVHAHKLLKVPEATLHKWYYYFGI